MKLLAIDTATEVCGIALVEEQRLVADYRLNIKNIHNEKLVQAIENLLSDANWRLNGLDGLAVSIGPGSFTGLRIGISVCKGLAFSHNLPVAAVNTMDALVHGIHFWQGPIYPIIKARATEVYTALYRNLNGLQRLTDYQIVNIGDFADLLKEKSLVIASPCSILKFLKSDLIVEADYELTISLPFRIGLIGHNKLMNNEIENPETLEPFYLKEFKPKMKKYYAA